MLDSTRSQPAAVGNARAMDPPVAIHPGGACAPVVIVVVPGRPTPHPTTLSAGLAELLEANGLTMQQVKMSPESVTHLEVFLQDYSKVDVDSSWLRPAAADARQRRRTCGS